MTQQRQGQGPECLQQGIRKPGNEKRTHLRGLHGARLPGLAAIKGLQQRLAAAQQEACKQHGYRRMTLGNGHPHTAVGRSSSPARPHSMGSSSSKGGSKRS